MSYGILQYEISKYAFFLYLPKSGFVLQEAQTGLIQNLLAKQISFHFFRDFFRRLIRNKTVFSAEMEFQEPASCSTLEGTINKFTSGKILPFYAAKQLFSWVLDQRISNPVAWGTMSSLGARDCLQSAFVEASLSDLACLFITQNSKFISKIPL